MPIGNCENCDRKNVPVRHIELTYCGDTTQCYLCTGDTDPDPYGELELPRPLDAVDNIRSGNVQAAGHAPVGERAEEIPGVFSLSERREKSKPSHIICIGLESLRQLSKQGMIWSEEHQCGVIAADDLFGADLSAITTGNGRNG